MWNLIVSIPDHCLFIYFARSIVYDIATSFMINLMVYSVNHGQVEYKRLRLGNFTHGSPKSAIYCIETDF